MGNKHSWWSKVTPFDMMRAIGLSDVEDVFRVFEFFESLGDGKCPTTRSWAWLWSHANPNDEHEIGQCEWNQLVPSFQLGLRQYGFSDRHWDSSWGVSAGLF